MYCQVRKVNAVNDWMVTSDLPHPDITDPAHWYFAAELLEARAERHGHGYPNNPVAYRATDLRELGDDAGNVAAELSAPLAYEFEIEKVAFALFRAMHAGSVTVGEWFDAPDSVREKLRRKARNANR